MSGSVSDFLYDGISGQELEVTLFDIRTIKTATDSFSNKNVLGEGGFGLVYKVSSHLACSIFV